MIIGLPLFIYSIECTYKYVGTIRYPQAACRSGMRRLDREQAIHILIFLLLLLVGLMFWLLGTGIIDRIPAV